MAVQQDPAVDNLESFIALLTDTIDKVQEEKPHLDAHAKALDELQDEAEGELGGFDRELDDDLAALDPLADETKDAIDRLEATATTGADGELEEATVAFGEWEGKLGTTLDAAAESVNSAAEDLGSEGFEDLDEALQDATRALEESRDATEAGFDALQKKLEHEGERFAGSLVTASLAAEEAAQAAEALETELEGKVNGMIAEIEGSSRSALSDHAATKTQVGTFYDGIESRAQSEAKEVVSEIQEALRQQAEGMREETETPIEGAIDSVLTHALAPFGDEVGHWKTQLDESAKELSTWDGFVDDLATTLVMVELIDEVKQAMD